MIDRLNDVWGAIPPPENDAAQAAVLAMDIRAANQRHLERSGTGHFQRPAYRACVAGAAICIVCIVRPPRPKPASRSSIAPTDDPFRPSKYPSALRGRNLLDTNDTKSLPRDISPILMAFKTSVIGWH